MGLRNLRKRAGFTQRELAKRADYPHSNIAKLETGSMDISQLSLRNAIRLGDALGGVACGNCWTIPRTEHTRCEALKQSSSMPQSVKRRQACTPSPQCTAMDRVHAMRQGRSAPGVEKPPAFQTLASRTLPFLSSSTKTPLGRGVVLPCTSLASAYRYVPMLRPSSPFHASQPLQEPPVTKLPAADGESKRTSSTTSP